MGESVKDILNDLCRLCARTDRYCVDVFGSDGQKYFIAKKIRLCLPVVVKQDDDMPSQICLSCLNKLDTSYELYTASITAQTAIKRLLKAEKDESKANKKAHDGLPLNHYLKRKCALEDREKPSKAQKIHEPEKDLGSNNTHMVSTRNSKAQTNVKGQNNGSSVETVDKPGFQKTTDPQKPKLRVKTATELAQVGQTNIVTNCVPALLPQQCSSVPTTTWCTYVTASCPTNLVFSQAALSQTSHTSLSSPRNIKSSSSAPQGGTGWSSTSQYTNSASSVQWDTTSSSSVPHNTMNSLPVPQNAMTSLPVPQNAMSLQCVPQNVMTSQPVPQNVMTSLPVLQNVMTSLPVPQNGMTSLPVPQSASASLPVAQNATTLLPVPHNAKTLLSVAKNATTLLPVPHNATASLSVPQNAKSLYVPQNAMTSLCMPQNATTSPSVPQNGVTVFSVPQNATTSLSVSQSVPALLSAPQYATSSQSVQNYTLKIPDSSSSGQTILPMGSKFIIVPNSFVSTPTVTVARTKTVTVLTPAVSTNTSVVPVSVAVPSPVPSSLRVVQAVPLQLSQQQQNQVAIAPKPAQPASASISQSSTTASVKFSEQKGKSQVYVVSTSSCAAVTSSDTISLSGGSNRLSVQSQNSTIPNLSTIPVSTAGQLLQKMGKSGASVGVPKQYGGPQLRRNSTKSGTNNSSLSPTQQTSNAPNKTQQPGKADSGIESITGRRTLLGILAYDSVSLNHSPNRVLQTASVSTDSSHSHQSAAKVNHLPLDRTGAKVSTPISSSQSHPEKTRATVSSPKATCPSSKATAPAPKATARSPKKRARSPKATARRSLKATALSPKATTPSPKATAPSPKATAPSPKATAPSPKATTPSPKATAPSPKATASSSQSKSSTITGNANQERQKCAPSILRKVIAVDSRNRKNRNDSAGSTQVLVSDVVFDVQPRSRRQKVAVTRPTRVIPPPPPAVLLGSFSGGCRLRGIAGIAGIPFEIPTCSSGQAPVRLQTPRAQRTLVTASVSPYRPTVQSGSEVIAEPASPPLAVIAPEVRKEECPFCHVEFPVDLLIHHKTLHYREKFYTCIDCDKNFVTERGLESHRCQKESRG